MSLGRPEKICPHARPGPWRRFSKRVVHKKLRLLAKLDPEGAPTKIGYYGWST